MGAVGIARKAHKIFISWKMCGGGIAQLLKNINRIVYCCDIAYQVDIPASTQLPHQGMGVVMHPMTVIGENCVIFQHTTFGERHGEDSAGGAPSIGNNVIVGVGATILGNIHVGNNVTIAAHAVVINDVPDNAIVAGILAEIKKYKIIEENKK